MTLALSIATLVSLALVAAFAAARSTYVLGRPAWVELLCFAALLAAGLTAVACLSWAALGLAGRDALRIALFGAADLAGAVYCWNGA